MTINSYSYLLLLGPIVLVYWLLPGQFRKPWLLLLSAAFYVSWQPKFFWLPFATAAVVFGVLRVMQSDKKRSAILVRGGIVLLLIPLAFFKYWHFVIVNLNGLLHAAGQLPLQTSLAIALPVGISFFTFDAIGMLLDARQGRIKNPRFWDVSLLLSFWPCLIAGPIVRFREIVPQLATPRKFDAEKFLAGLDRLVLGLVQKNLIANNLAAIVDEGFLPRAALTNSTVDNWMLAVAYGLQIYFDFASYTNMAIGAARLMGINLPENFRFPYHASNPSDFWSRWHISLSRWIRDYLFFPINAKYGGAALPLYASLVGIMALVGLWHGAGWGFILWGAMHGISGAVARVGECH